jgi:hypothetical protein
LDKPRNQSETFEGISWITRVSMWEEIDISAID